MGGGGRGEGGGGICSANIPCDRTRVVAFIAQLLVGSWISEKYYISRICYF